jgi:A/G-specific adenine glycosylase
MGIQGHKLNISEILIDWYSQNKRDLPWRDIEDPYKIWISEIILQQTRVNQGLDYYLRFIDKFPTVAILANAEENEVLNYWQGLGYYSRARNLHKAAKQIRNEYDGIFPVEYTKVLSLAGIGSYTAAAICSFAYHQPHAVVDGNVYRVLSRIFGVETAIDSGQGKKEFELLAREILSVHNPAAHNQSIMEFGALQCVPVSPNCTFCPLKNNCKAYKLDLVAFLPLKSKKTKVKQRFFNYLFVSFEGNTFLQKRIAKDVWQNLYEFPLIESDRILSLTEIIANDEFKSIFENSGNVEVFKISNPMKHVLSHRVIFAQLISVNVSELNEPLSKKIQIPICDIDRYPVSRLMELFLESISE